LAKASKALVGRSLEYSDARLLEIMSPRYFIEVRRTLGGPAPDETGRALAESRRLLGSDHDEWQARRNRLRRAEQTLAERVSQL
jgi:hypothetical protein